VDPAGERPARQGWPPAGNESCVAMGRPILRSVDSEDDGCVIEPRNQACRGSRTHWKQRRQHRSTQRGLVPRSPRGQRTTASVQGFAQEPGRSHHLRRQKSRKDRRQQPVQACGRQVSAPPRERIDGHRYGTAERRKRSDAGKRMGSQSAPTVPRRRGNRPKGPRGGKRSARARNRWRER
jgi:hypothetical protein